MSLSYKTTVAAIGIFLLGALLGAECAFFISQLEDSNHLGKTLRLEEPIFPLIKPLLACNIDAQEPTQTLNSLRANLEDVVQKRKDAGDVNRVGIYIRDLANGSWTAVNGDDKFTPGSLMKIITLMAYLVEVDADPTIVNHSLPASSTTSVATQNILPEHTAEPGKTYTVKELLELMMMYSDNTAKQTLVEHLNPDTYNQILNALEIPGFAEDSTIPYAISPRLYSRIIRILYNSTLLSQPSSEYALELMSQSAYTNALVQGVEPGTVVAHKFGEIGISQPDGTIHYQHHDCGIIYQENPYAICVMTEGNDLAILAETIAELATMTDTFMMAK